MQAQIAYQNAIAAHQHAAEQQAASTGGQQQFLQAAYLQHGE
jgi:hypothetical protein